MGEPVMRIEEWEHQFRSGRTATGSSCVVWPIGAGRDPRVAASLPWRPSTTVRTALLLPAWPVWSRRSSASGWRFNAQGPEGLKEGKAEGPAHKLNQQQREALAAIVESGPDHDIHGVVRWRLCDLVGWIKENFAVSMVETTVGRELRRMGYVKLSARPRHYAQDKAEREAFKKTSPAHQGNPRRTGGWRRRG